MFHDLYISPPRADRVLVLDTVSVFNKSVKTTIAVGIPRLGGARGAFQELKKRIQTVNLKWLILPLKDAVKKISRWAFSVFFSVEIGKKCLLVPPPTISKNAPYKQVA